MDPQENSSENGSLKVHKDTTHLVDSGFKLPTFNWLHNVPSGRGSGEYVEVRFKNTRKGIFNNVHQLRLQKGDIVAVEASPGHDLGIVSLTGELVREQLKKYNIDPKIIELKKIYRKAKPVDIDKWDEARTLEHETMLRARKLAEDLKLDMKIGDVEYQGDKTKAIFYYIAEERVDFRELIKVLAEQFRVRIEMRQIGARQEAGRIGGIGSCGRELCCSTWITNFSSVSTTAARYQDLSLNPQKLAGQCGKLKCCLNYELDVYIDAQKDFPRSDIALETNDGTAHHQKTDIFKKIMWYSFDPNSSLNIIPVPADRVNEIIRQNKAGKKPDTLVEKTETRPSFEPSFNNAVGQESLTRFDRPRKKKKKKSKNRNK